jgi:glutathione synthase/RimK-type ligase-like ATP-grasp enzyme
MTKIGYVTYADNPADPDPDLDIAVFTTALRRAGYEVEIVDWQLPLTPNSFDALLIRSTWNYAQNLISFKSWLHEIAAQTRVINPVSVILHNLDKRYLFELAYLGIPTIPTVLIENADQIFEKDLPSSKLVFKPVIGAGARGAFVATGITESVDEVQAHFHQSDLPLLVQPYLTEVESQGEIAVVCCNGEPLHAIVKKPALTEGGHGDFAGNVELSADLLEFVERINQYQIGNLKVKDLYYSRIDVVPTSDGLKLMELELFEPTLFLNANRNSAEIFAAGIKSHLA